MSTFDTLPVILVSAINETAATELISELIDNDVTADFLKDTRCLDRVWRLVNKYYTVNVRVHALADHGRLEVNPDVIEAHVIHITEEEALDSTLSVARAEARVAAGAGAWRRAAVRLLLAGAASDCAALQAWAAAQRADAVALRAPPPLRGEGEREPFEEESGMARARAALHAHVWRGLRRTDRAAPPPPEASVDSSCAAFDSSDEDVEEDEEDEEAEERRAVEQAEAFAAALGALGPALAARAGPGPQGAPGPADREQAEALVLAFCRALGLDPATC